MASLKTPFGITHRVEWLRSYYFKGADRPWTNEYTSWTTGTSWDSQFSEITFYIVPEVYTLLQAMGGSFRLAARPVVLRPDFWELSLPERRAWFVKEVMTEYLPKEILPGDLLAGARFNIQTSLCLDKKEARDFERLTIGPKGARRAVLDFHNHGYGNAGATSGHVIPGYERALKLGWKGIFEEIEARLASLSESERRGEKGAQVRAMMTSARMPGELAAGYAALCSDLAAKEAESVRRAELELMASTLRRVPWLPARDFREALQALWMNHMLVMADENYPGPGVSFGRVDQYLLPYWLASKRAGMSREEAKELLGCFWFHCNTAYDAQVRTGNNGITAGFGQLLTLGGLRSDGEDASNELTTLFLEVIDEMSPILEPKPNMRLHRDSPDAILDKVVAMIESSQGAPFLLNFDERAMAGMMREVAHGRRRRASCARTTSTTTHSVGLPREHYGRQRPLGHGGLQPQPAQGGGARPDRRPGPPRLHRSHDGQDRAAQARRPGHGRSEPLPYLGGILGRLRRADALTSSARSPSSTRRASPYAPASFPRPTCPAWSRAASRRASM